MLLVEDTVSSLNERRLCQRRRSSSHGGFLSDKLWPQTLERIMAAQLQARMPKANKVTSIRLDQLSACLEKCKLYLPDEMVEIANMNEDQFDRALETIKKKQVKNIDAVAGITEHMLKATQAVPPPPPIHASPPALIKYAPTD